MSAYAKRHGLNLPQFYQIKSVLNLSIRLQSVSGRGHDKTLQSSFDVGVSREHSFLELY